MLHPYSIHYEKYMFNFTNKRPIRSRVNKIINLSFIVSILLLLTTLSGCKVTDMALRKFANATATQTWKNDAKIAQLPIKMLNDHIILPVRINGGDELNFIFDSGATTTVIFESHNTKKLKLNKSFPIYLSGAGEGESSVAYNVKDTNISLDKLELEGLSVVYLPVESMGFFNELDEVYFDGVIGYDFLKRFPIEINYDQMQINIYRNHDELPKEIAQNWEHLNIEIEAGLPVLSTKIQITKDKATTANLVLDTGYTDPLSLNLSTSDKLIVPGKSYTASLKGMTGREVSKVAINKSITLGKHIIREFPSFYSEASNIRTGNGVLGNKILSKFNLLFDYENDSLFIKPNGRFSKLISADRSGLQVYPHRLGGFVDEVADGSGADILGLKQGDIITKLDRIDITDETLDLLQIALTSQKKSLAICWLSSEKINCGNLHLSTRI